jgi:ubiquinone/menaquinone biosynthesis C-methylase UbiE
MTGAVPDRFYQTYKPRLQRRIARELRRATRVVDLGCGDCELAGFLCDAKGRQVIGVDIHDGGFPSDTNRPGRPQCIKANARRLDFLATGAVDAVVSVFALHELAAPRASLREAKRMLRPGGEILIVDFPRGSLAQRLWNEGYYTTTEVGKMLRRVGFVRVTARRTARRQLTWACGFKRLRQKGRR